MIGMLATQTQQLQQSLLALQQAQAVSANASVPYVPPTVKEATPQEAPMELEGKEKDEKWIQDNPNDKLPRITSKR